MASTTFALVDARKSILEDGFFSIDDSVVGEHVLEMQQKDFPFASEYGLEFCKLNVLDDTRIRSILESLFEWSGLSTNPPSLMCPIDNGSTPSINSNSALLQHARTYPSIAQHTMAPLNLPGTLPPVPTEDSWGLNNKFSNFNSSLPPAPTEDSWGLNNRFSNFDSSLPLAPNSTFGSGTWECNP